METRTCTTCERILNIDHFRMGRKKCLDCTRIAARDAMRKRRLEVPDIVKEQKRQSYNRHAEKNRERNQALYQANRDSRLKYAAEYRAKNRDRLNEWHREYRRTHPERRAEKDYKSHRKRRDKRRASDMQYRANNRIVIRLRNRARKAKIKYSIGQFRPRDWNFCLEYWRHSCAVCGCQSSAERVICTDHWIPLSAGGGTDRVNIIPLCHGIDGCNNSKKNHPPDVWLIRRIGVEAAALKMAEINTYFAALTIPKE